MSEREHDRVGHTVIQRNDNPVAIYFDFLNRGFELAVDAGHGGLVRPTDLLTNHDRDILKTAQARDELWEVVRTFELMQTWRQQPLTFNRLATFTLPDLSGYDYRNTPIHPLYALQRASHGMARSSATSGDEDATHLWVMRARILGAELDRRNAGSSVLEVGR